MNVPWFTTRAALLLLVLAIYPSSALPQQRDSQESDNASRLRIAQSIAVSDFDADGLIDEANLNGFGRHKRVRIFLSGTRKLSYLEFESRTTGHGSLLSQDVDGDGAPDLIWTDLFRADSVIVWLGDGSGEFEQLIGHRDGGGFILGEANVGAPSNFNPETAINCESNSPLDFTPTQIFTGVMGAPVANGNSYPLRTSSPALDQPADRGPPPLAF